MIWLQIKFLAPQAQVDEWSDLLLSTGATAITLHDKDKQAIFEPNPGDTPLWEHVQITGLYTIDTDLDSIKEQLYQHIPKDVVFHIEQIEDEDWQNAWKKNLSPIQFGPNFWICPSWCDIPNPTAINVILDPGLAFGTGTHPTTALCLEWIATNVNQNDTVLDFGCGSGILGIAAAKLGASQVYCVDCDPQALFSTQENAEKNKISRNQLLTYYPEELTTKFQVNIVIANILANPLEELAQTLANHVKPSGNIVLSGILTTQVEHLITIYNKWFENLTVTTKEDWVRITGIKKM
jgi:ribosomal protein L11 methyltransferase